MNERQRFGMFTVVPAFIALAPVFLPLYARLHPRAPEWLETDDVLTEMLDSMLVWAVICPLYLLFALTQPEEDVSRSVKKRLALVLGTLSVIGVLQGFRLFLSLQ